MKTALLTVPSLALCRRCPPRQHYGRQGPRKLARAQRQRRLDRLRLDRVQEGGPRSGLEGPIDTASNGRLPSALFSAPSLHLHRTALFLFPQLSWRFGRDLQEHGESLQSIDQAVLRCVRCF